MDPLNALFWNLVSAWKKFENAALAFSLDGESTYFAFWWCHRPTSHNNNNNNNNNNGGLHACASAAEDIEPEGY